MRLTYLLPVALSLCAFACQSTSTSVPEVVQADAARRDSLLSAVSALEGRWRGASPDGQTKYTEFAVTSAGSAVREVMMPGEDHEMVNMYSLDGNTLVMTHYCAGGNQPRMRATSIEDGRMSFVADGVSDLKADDEVYMGAMTLVIVDQDHVQQNWSALKAGELDHEMVIELTRVE